jgi:SAM-dependent methyltransferase
MGFYSRHISPRPCEWMMSDPRMAALRQELLSDVGGDVLEIGFGTGLNLPRYPKQVGSLTTVELNPGMNILARRRVSQSGIAVDQRSLGGEVSPFGDDTLDCMMSTWTLCSIPEAGRALAETYLVLRPGGRFAFLEHGLAAGPRVQNWQRRPNPVRRPIGDGCRLDLDVEVVVREQPFGGLGVEQSVMNGVPRTHGTMYRDVATK